MADRYEPASFEAKWRQRWKEADLFKTREDANRPKFYGLDFFPYPSGAGLSVGHCKNYVPTDVLCRMKYMQGFNVLHPMGFDAFGLPAENEAIKRKRHPQEMIDEYKATYRRQMELIGVSYDWSRSFASCDAEFMKGTQRIFKLLYEKGLAYRKMASVNWCPKDKTALANEEVVGGLCERCGTPVEKRDIPQWFFGITEYAQRLIDDLDTIDWPEGIKVQQRNWIGRSEGVQFRMQAVVMDKRQADAWRARSASPVGVSAAAPARELTELEKLEEEIRASHKPADVPPAISERIASLEGALSRAAEKVNQILPDAPAFEAMKAKIELAGGKVSQGGLPTFDVFTTRVDTVFGMTFCVLAPEHPLIEKLLTSLPQDRREAIRAYQDKAKSLSAADRQAITREKTGVFTGAYAINPVNEDLVPIWIADYVLMDYGTGAIMAVPGHDERDFAFAEKYRLPIIQVIRQTGELPDARLITADLLRAWAFRGRVGTPQTRIAFQNGIWHSLFRIARVLQHHATLVHIRDFLIDSYERAMYENRLGDTLGPEAKALLNHAEDLANFLFERKEFEEPEFAPDLPFETKDGALVNSGWCNGLTVMNAQLKLGEWMEAQGIGVRKVQFKLRDWLISRQRYWGCPIPVVHREDGSMELVPEEQLPVLLPDVENYEPGEDGQSPLARIDFWVNTKDSFGKPARRETDTMGGFADSSWYFLRFCDPHNAKESWDRKKAAHWMPVDTYVGGAEHAVMHLLYARFWTKVLYDAGLCTVKEPFARLENQGQVLALTPYRTPREGERLDIGEDGILISFAEAEQMPRDQVMWRWSRMSKSKGNVVTPDEAVESYGADALRLYILFVAPFDGDVQWDNKGMEGTARFLSRIFRFVSEHKFAFDPKWRDKIGSIAADDFSRAVRHATHTAIRDVTERIEKFEFNTYISGMMIFLNDLSEVGKKAADGGSEAYRLAMSEALETLVLLIGPAAPHTSDELWSELGHTNFSFQAEWPKLDAALAVADTNTIAVQVNGKLRDTIEMPANATNEELEKAALASAKVKPYLEGKTVKKVIVIPGKLVNVVVA